MLIPVKGKMFWPKNIKGLVLPPLVKKMSSRLAKKRIGNYLKERLELNFQKLIG